MLKPGLIIADKAAAEYAIRDPRKSGKKLLQQIAAATGDAEMFNAAEFFNTAQRKERIQPEIILIPFLVTLIILLLLESAERRINVLTRALGWLTRKQKQPVPETLAPIQSRPRIVKASPEKKRPPIYQKEAEAPAAVAPPASQQPRPESKTEDAMARVKKRRRS